MRTIEVIDSHTGGEPTRVIVAGGPDLGAGPLAERRARFERDFDAYRTATNCEPRGSDVLVGALLCAPVDAAAAGGVIFYNNVGYLGMCVHGTIGVAATLAYLGRIGPGPLRLETPVGDVVVVWHADGRATVTNVPSYRLRTAVTVDVPGEGPTTGDVAWGGNWFFLVREHAERIALDNVERLTEYAWRVRRALRGQGVTGAAGAEIDHVELFGPPTDATVADSKNFVLCPGKVYDRSPCGTGTSAKLACLVADGRVRPGQVWRQESIVGSVFEAVTDDASETIVPHITGSSHVTGRATLLLDDRDPYCWGLTNRG